ncbi:hypothetical protein IscW_ISCW000269 [Ixodes scapularis]|uniref:Uncharacterized protein n=1 Tax=Ixodes scapularis TaxID=6945 RepID=B7P1B9_IXOSC|nr:hypothetical protein IscW_ISCW000269 [Ixodes scapularis]|eukprot:XP_002433327.1 hypothetical protein IscW_ISCW000269 [Ixodes scapularis]
MGLFRGIIIFLALVGIRVVILPIILGNLAKSRPSAATNWFVKVDLASYCRSTAVVRVAMASEIRRRSGSREVCMTRR